MQDETALQNNGDSEKASSFVKEDFAELLRDVKRVENCNIDFSDNIVRIDERTIVDRIKNVCIISVKNTQGEITGYIVFNLTELIRKTIHG